MLIINCRRASINFIMWIGVGFILLSSCKPTPASGTEVKELKPVPVAEAKKPEPVSVTKANKPETASTTKAKDQENFIIKADKVDEYRKEAEKGDAIAQLKLGICYLNSLGVPSNRAQAERWIRKSADQELPAGERVLGYWYLYGMSELDGDIVLVKDEAEAYKWINKAADQGCLLSQTMLGCLYEGKKKYIEAAKWFKKASDQGFAEAQCNLGVFYMTGTVFEKDKEEAVRLWQKSANQGYVQAQAWLARCYTKGIGVAKDEAEAKKWADRPGVTFELIWNRGELDW